MASSWTEFVERFHRHFTDDPNARVLLGIDRDLGELNDPSLTAIDAHVERALGLIAELDALPAQVASFDETIDRELARLKLRAEVHTLKRTCGGRREIQQKPTAGDDIGESIFMMSIIDPRPDHARLADIQARLEAVPAYVDALLGRLDTPVARWVAMDLAKTEGLGSLFDSMVNWGEETTFPDLARLKASRDRAVEALASYRESLARLETTADFHVGLETTESIIELRGVPHRSGELKEMAIRFLAETAGEVDTLRDRLVSKYDLDRSTSVDGLHEFLNERFSARTKVESLDGILDLYRAEAARVRGLIEQRHLFPIVDNQEMRILRTPRFFEPSIPAGAMASPPPFREGKRISVVYLTLKEDGLDDHTLLGVPVMMVHEGIPGHHLQLATASMHPSIIRRHIDAPDHAEGWATMLEDYMLDLGLMGDLTDEARFIGKRDISRMGARVAIDLFFMSGDKAFLDVGVDADLSSDDPFAAASSLLRAVTGFSEQRAQAELNWYSQERGYPLSYLVGNRSVLRLKRELHGDKGADGLDLDRRFHALYLNSGVMPLPFLRRILAHEGLV